MHHRSTHPALRRGLVAALFAAAMLAADADAGTVIGHCVSTAQQLQNALTSASAGGQYAGMDNRIKIVAGLYQTRLVTSPSPGSFYYASTAATGTLSVEGGYNADCSARSSDPLATLLDGNGLYTVMDLRSAKAQIKVSGVTIENGEATTQGAGLSINAAGNNDSTALVFDAIIRNNHTTSLGGGLYAASDGAGNRTVVHNTLFVDNVADQGISAVELVGDGDGITFYDNTVTNNSVPGGDGTSRSVYIDGPSATRPTTSCNTTPTAASGWRARPRRCTTTTSATSSTTAERHRRAMSRSTPASSIPTATTASTPARPCSVAACI